MTDLAIREQAAAFLDQLREGVAQKVQKDAKCFKNMEPISSWDVINNRPIVANILGWLPDILPQYAKWKNLPWPEDIMVYFMNRPLNWVVNQSPSPDPCFYPQYEGIPIQKIMWEAIVTPYSQFFIRVDELSPFWGFKRVNAWWESIIQETRAGKLDRYLIFSDDIKGYKLNEVPAAEEWLYDKHKRFKDLLAEYKSVKGKEEEVRAYFNKMRSKTKK